MSYKSLLLKKAKDELAEAWSWYEDRLTGLGDRFEKEVYKRIHQIELTPDRYPEKKKPYRETLIKVFPYLLIYRIEKKNKLIIIVSIFHTKRNPKKKYRV